MLTRGARARRVQVIDSRTDEERLTQSFYIALALSGKRRKVPDRFRPKRVRTPRPLAWT